MPLLPTRRCAAIIAIAGAAFLLDATFALLLDAALLLVIVIEGVALMRAPLPQLVRTLPPRVPLGASVEVKLEMRHTSDSQRIVEWTDDAGPGLGRAGAHVLGMAVPPHRGAVQSYRLNGLERGRTWLGDVHLRVQGPLGLLWRQQRIAMRTPVVVQPGLRELHRQRVLALHHRIAPGARRVRELGEGREFERLREYVRGDDPRRIDWKATARRAQPIVRQYEAERSQSIVIAIDAGRLMMERFGGRERLDHALGAALILADAAAVHGDSVGVLMFADRVQAFLPPARTPLARIADLLVTVDARRVEPDYPAAFRYLGRNVRRRSLVVLFSDIIDMHASAALLEHLGASARRHLPLIVAMRNVDLEGAAQSAVTEDAQAYHRAAAEELLQARAVALNSVRRRGVLVADTRPDAAIEETMARYLEIKQRGLL